MNQSKVQLNYNRCNQGLGSEQVEELEEVKSRISEANGFPLDKEITSKDGQRGERSNTIRVSQEFLNFHKTKH